MRWMPRRSRFALLVLLCFAGPAEASWPSQPGDDLTLPASWPSDPDYADQWNLWSFMPAANLDQVTAYEASVGSGIHADVAWQTTIGDPSVVIAVLDSGIRWDNADLVNKMYLNRGELPVPGGTCPAAPGADLHDANADGVFNVQDYSTATGHTRPTAATLCDPRITDDNANGVIDGHDVITAFSDGVDDDANGWTDDISGWDVFRDDNDPGDDTNFGHGTGVANDAAAETDNGAGSAGVCPRCLVMMVRMSDSFISETNDFAAGLIYATDAGASVIQAASGSLDNTPTVVKAIDYAWKRHATFVGTAGDEDSFHPEYPSINNHAFYVHSTRFDSTERNNATTFMAFNNCTNYGPQLLLSTPGEGCSSEATGKTGGISGLLQSAAIGVGLPSLEPATDPMGSRRLRPEEIKQLLLITADDIYDPDDATNPDRYVTYPGWEQRFGYGRTNVAAAVAEVVAQRIPPVVDIQGPIWLATIQPGREVSITGELSYRTDLFDSFDYVVEWARGVEPGDDDWTEIARGDGETEAMVGELAAFTPPVIDNPRMPEPDVDVNRYLITVRIRVTLHATGPRDGTRGEIRRAFHVHHDDTLRDGFPVKLDGSGDGSPKVTDLDGDGDMEIVFVDSAGTVHLLDGSGNEQTGWPARTAVARLWRDGNHAATAAVTSGEIDPEDIRSAVAQGPAVGDLDGSGPGGKQIVVATVDGEIEVFDADGTRKAGFPVALDRSFLDGASELKVVDDGVFGAPVLADLDVPADGTLEIIVAAMDGHVYAWHHDGAGVDGFPVQLKDGDQDARTVQTPSVGDIDGDGDPEIVLGNNESYNGLARVYALHHDGSYVDGWPIGMGTQSVLPIIGTGMPNNTALADFDGDGVVDVVACGIVSLPQLTRGDGSIIGFAQNSPFGELTTSDDMPAIIAIANGSIGDLDRDGAPDIIWSGAGIGFAEAFAGAGRRVDIDHQLNVWSSRSKLYLPGFPQRVDDHQFFMNPSVADLDADGRPEVISASGGYYVHAFDADGVEPEGWPKFTGAWMTSAPAVGDLDGDGGLDVVIATRDGFLYAWTTDGRADGVVQWASFHHDDANTGNYTTPIGFGRPSSTGGGGCCGVGPGGGGLGSVVLGLFVLVVLRRRS